MSGCTQGIVTVAGTVQLAGGIISGCSIEGIRVVQGSASMAAALLQGNTEGADVQSQSSLTMAGGYVYYNVNNGLKANFNSFIYAGVLGFVTNGTNASPAVNTAGGTANQSYIYWTAP